MNVLAKMVAVVSVCGMAASSQALTLDLIETPDDPIAELSAALLAAGSGVTIVGGTETFVGAVGNGVTGNTAQSATYTGFNLVPNNAGPPTITNPDGIFLTSGTANIPLTNTNTSFDPFFPGTGGDADLTAILVNAGAPSSVVNDVNFFEFDFTVAAGQTSVEADFVFGSDEFPDQGVTDVFGFFVDGVNFAFFADGTLVSFVQGANAANFNDNSTSPFNYDLEYDGISNSLHIVGILDPSLATHTLKIAIGDTSDSIFDSGVFIGNLRTGTETGEGGVNNPGGNNGAVPEPITATLSLMGLGVLGMATRRRVA